jgi:hypothetical protein
MLSAHLHANDEVKYQIQKRWGRLYQFVPAEIARKRNVPLRILLPAENMLIFTLPKPLRRKIQRVRDSLTRLSDIRSGAAMYEMSQNIVNYDYKDHERTEKLALAQCCAATGWDARGWYRQETTEYAKIGSAFSSNFS